MTPIPSQFRIIRRRELETKLAALSLKVLRFRKYSHGREVCRKCLNCVHDSAFVDLK